ncbi:F-box associated interaction domain, partial [Arabidopsis thaliana x Arabidopsis arenosa]
MFDIPLDLVEEILSRVPATSFKRLRSTCRRWNALLKDPRFTEKHSRKAPKESIVLMLKEYRVCPISVNLNITPPSIEFQGALGLKDSHSNLEQVKITEVFHCNGLLLCTTKGNRLVVWNPCLGETKWIQLKVDYGRNGSKFALGYIQNNQSCRSYKILWSWYSYDYKSSPPQIVLGFEIYEFSSDSWRVLDDVNHDSLLNHNSIIGTGVSLKGNTCLLAYDLKVVREEQLSILNWSRTTSKMEIWITNNIDTDATLLWRLHLDTRCNCVRIFSSLLIDEEKKVVLCCNVNDDETSKNM